MRKKSNSKPMFKKSIYEDLEEKGTSLILLRFIQNNGRKRSNDQKALV